MRVVISVVWQTIVFWLAALAGFAAGVAVPSLRVSRELSHTATNVRTYDFDWLIAVLLVYALLLVVGALRRRLRSAAISATVALVIVVAGIALFTQLGVKDAAL